MTTGRFRRGALRGLGALVLGPLAAVGGLVVFAPGASADPAVTVEIKDLTPPLVSVDAGGTVTFVDEIEDKTVQVGGGGLLPSLVDVVVHTDVTLTLPSGTHPLQRDQKWKETFPQTCATCTITYTYRATVADGSVVGAALGTVTGKAVAAMPQQRTLTYDGRKTTVTIGVPTPFVVNTLVPLPNLPSVNLPQLPKLTVPAPATGPVPAPGGAPGGSGGGTGTTTITTHRTTVTQTRHGIDGAQYAYDTGSGAPQLSPQGGGAAAFDPGISAGGSGPSDRFLTGGAGSGARSGYDGTSVPVVGRGTGPDAARLDDASADGPAGGAGRSALPVPALVAVLSLAAVLTGLLRVHQARRAVRSGRPR